MVQVTPSNSVEFETLTTQPSYPDVSEDEFDVKNKILSHNVRDVRFGNLNRFTTDIPYLENRNDLVSAFMSFRGGMFRDTLAPFVKSQVVSVVELSQSSGGFFRKNHQTINQAIEQTDKSEGGFKLFGKKRF